MTSTTEYGGVCTLPHSGFTRIPYVQPCLIDGTSRGVTCNISLVGLYVAVDPIPSYGATVTVSMRLPGLDRLIEMPMVVAWVNPDKPVEALVGQTNRTRGLFEGAAK
jgi:hypothetical protein